MNDSPRLVDGFPLHLEVDGCIPIGRGDAGVAEPLIGGFKPNATNFDSLVVGDYQGKDLLCAGKVRSGFTPGLREQVFRSIRDLLTPRCPFANLPSTRPGRWGEGITAEEMRTLQWVKPRQVAEISFADWTRDGSLRHAALFALRDDKRAKDVGR